MRTINHLNAEDIQKLYQNFDSPITSLDCGKKCAVHNPTHKPFCCDICQAVPAAYKSEWDYLQSNTNLWHTFRGDECDTEDKISAKKLRATTPKSMILLACLGPNQCERDFRALSCRQFPFFPYVTSDYRFLGLAYEWEFEDRCWVASNLNQVTLSYREQFVKTFDRIFSLFQDIFDNYAYHSELLRDHYTMQNRRFALLHRNGGSYLVSPKSERIEKVDIAQLPKFGFYK